MSTTLIHNGRLIGADGVPAPGWVLIDGERIAACGTGEAAPAGADTCVDARGALILPGMIDAHVHFREPGLTHKATIASESRAAVLGGVTSYMEMPNTVPPTTTLRAVADKQAIAARDSAANYAFFLGASETNIGEIAALDPRESPGVKLFIGSSTGNMAVNSPEALEAVFSTARVPVMVHAEDDSIIAANAAAAREKYGNDVPVGEHPSIRSAEACLSAAKRAISLAKAHGRRLHIAHLTTAAETELIRGEELVTAEATPLHLLFDSGDYAALGSRIKVNPAVKSRADREALRAAVADGRIAAIGSDHAPHLADEKRGGSLKAASGAPSVQFALPVLLGLFPPAIVQARYSAAPAALFDIRHRGAIAPGNYADIVLVDECAPYTVGDADSASPCGWTPFAGVSLRHRVRDVWVNGTLTVSDGRLTGLTGAKPLRFDRPADPEKTA